MQETAALKRQGVQVIGIAAGTKLNIDKFIDNLHAIVADKSLVFTTSFHGLDTIVDKITKSTCDMGKQSLFEIWGGGGGGGGGGLHGIDAKIEW